MRKVQLLSALFFLGLFIQSCKKDGKLTPEFEENNSNVYYNDSSTVKSYTVKEDSILSSKTSRALVGIYHDSVFGEVRSSFFSRMSMVGTNLDFGVPINLTVDSVVFAFKYAEIYGNKEPQTIEIFELTEGMNGDIGYYSNDSIAFNPTPLGTKLFTPTLDSVFVGGTAFAPQLRIKLDNALGQRFLDESGKSTFSTQENFKAFFKGIHIKTTSLSSSNTTRGAITYFEPTSIITGLYIHYTDVSTGVAVSKLVRFSIATDNQRFCNFKHDYTGSVIEQVMNGTASDTNVTYSQTMAGVKSLIKFPFIKNITEQIQKPIINQAEIIIPVIQGSTNQFGYPNKVILVAADSSGLGTFLPDFFVGEDYYGGVYSDLTKDYRFNITRHIHNIVNKNKDDYGLYLIISGTSVSAGRVIIQKQVSNLEGIKLNLTYSTTE